MLLTTIALLLALALIALTIKNLQAVVRLPILPPVQPPPAAPRLSIIIPARNEARSIERCVRGALSQRYPQFEVIVVDDRSTDATGAILGRLRQDSQALQVINGTALPPGWKGKQHALSQGYARASGDWLLFLDADTAPLPQLAASLIDYAQGRRIDMLTIVPLLELGSFWERVILPAFASLVAAAFPPAEINRPDSPVALANGQCILISRQSYEAVGGHAAVRGDIAEDLALARRVKAAGLRLFMADGRHLLSVRMYRNGREVIEGLTKNAMAGVEIGGMRTLRGVLRQTLLAIGPLLLLGTWLWMHLRRRRRRQRQVIAAAAWTAAPLTIWGWCRMYRTLFAQPARYGLLYPLGIICYGLIGCYAALRLRLGRGVTWKGRRYDSI